MIFFERFACVPRSSTCGFITFIKNKLRNLPGITFHHDLDLEGPGVLLLAECPGSDNTCSELSQVVNVTQAFHWQVWFLTDYSICNVPFSPIPLHM